MRTTRIWRPRCTSCSAASRRVNATASILADTRDIAGAWRDRFHRNLAEDSTRLAEGAQALVRYLDEASEKDLGASTPQDEVELWLTARGFHLSELERALPAETETVLRDAPQIKSRAARDLASRYLSRYRADAERMPQAAFAGAAAAAGYDPLVLAAQFGTDAAAAMRRIATLPEANGQPPIGLVCCDGSGMLTFRKPTEGFVLPRVGATCPLWPLYQALNRPMVPIRVMVEMAGRDSLRFLTCAIAQPQTGGDFNVAPVYQATMLILPAERIEAPDIAAQRIGSSCRICPRESCEVRREPSILAVSA